jgi:osmotically inducible lipoprotein OsmB
MIATIFGRRRSAGVQEGHAMTKSLIGLALAALLATACGDTWGQRAVTGGAIGAGSGAVVGAATGMGPLTGAVVGGAVGAGVGAATTPKRRYYHDRYYD